MIRWRCCCCLLQLLLSFTAQRNLIVIAFVSGQTGRLEYAVYIEKVISFKSRNETNWTQCENIVHCNNEAEVEIYYFINAYAKLSFRNWKCRRMKLSEKTQKMGRQRRFGGFSRISIIANEINRISCRRRQMTLSQLNRVQSCSMSQRTNPSQRALIAHVALIFFSLHLTLREFPTGSCFVHIHSERFYWIRYHYYAINAEW